MTHAAVTRNSSLPCSEKWITSGYQDFADSRIPEFGLMMRSAICESACCARRGCAASLKYVPRSASVSGRVNVVMYHSRNGISTKANVSTRIAMSHFLAIPDLAAGAGEAEDSTACGMLFIFRSFVACVFRRGESGTKKADEA